VIGPAVEQGNLAGAAFDAHPQAVVVGRDHQGPAGRQRRVSGSSDERHRPVRLQVARRLARRGRLADQRAVGLAREDPRPPRPSARPCRTDAREQLEVEADPAGPFGRQRPVEIDDDAEGCCRRAR
jgi:hypothetical protein